MFAPSFQSFAMKMHYAAPIFGGVFVFFAFFFFQTGCGPTVSKVMSLQTEVDKDHGIYFNRYLSFLPSG